MAKENNLDLEQPPTVDQLPFSLPPYPQMIMEAIEACTDTSGLNKTAISKHIESTQLTLPPSHTTLLNYHLNQMKSSGQIVQVKFNFLKPDLNAPPPPPPAKRGRGRPPKAKPDGDSVAVSDPVVATRGRGRPPKAKEVETEKEEVETVVTVGEKRGRGRPPKKAKTESSEKKEEVETVTVGNGEKRGRGRPPKVKPEMVPVGC